MAGAISGRRKAIPIDVKRTVLHEAGYKCANPVCRHIITLDIHHMIYVADGGTDTAENLLPLCPNCHALHHAGQIPVASIRTWKMLLLSLNEAFDRRSVDILLTLDKLEHNTIKRLSGDGIATYAPLIAAEYVNVRQYYEDLSGGGFAQFEQMYLAELTDKGKLLVQAWKQGDQAAAVGSVTIE